MGGERLVWFEQTLPFRRLRSGRVELPIADLTGGPSDDPVVAVETGHWFTDIGFFFLMRDLLQIAMPPADEQAWIERLLDPPEPAGMRAALAPYAEAFDLVHPELPAMQVRPTAEARQPKGKAKAVGEDEDEDEDEAAEPAGTQALARLLPDVPTINNEARGTSFFGRLGDATPPLAAGVVVPLLYADMVLFPSAGGGHFGLPTGIDTIKFAVVGDTLWRSLWANIAPGTRTSAGSSAFPWRDPRFRERPVGKDGWFKEPGNQLYPSSLAPGHIPMPRRYLLGQPRRTACALTGMGEATCFATFERWPNGPMYAPSGFRPVWAAARQTTGAKAAPGKVDYRKASGPLRFDDWLEIGLGRAVEGEDKTAWSLPDAIARFRTRLDAIADALDARGELDQALETTLAPELPFRVRATAMVLKGKTSAASSARELPLWRIPADTHQELVDSVAEVVAEVGKVADVLGEQARSCVKLAEGMKAPEVAAALKDALKAAMDEVVIDLPRRLVGERDQDRIVAAADKVVIEAVDAARRLFDETFPITGVDRASLAAARARRELRVKLGKLDPRQRNAGGKQQERRRKTA